MMRSSIPYIYVTIRDPYRLQQSIIPISFEKEVEQDDHDNDDRSCVKVIYELPRNHVLVYKEAIFG